MPRPARYSNVKDWKGVLRRELARDLRKKDRETLRELRAAIREARQARRAALSRIVAQCRAARDEVRERAKARRAAALAELAAAKLSERAAARSTCDTSKAAAKAEHTTELAKRRARHADERDRQRAEHRVERGKPKGKPRRTAAEALAESDDEVRSNIPADLVPVWNIVKRTIRGNNWRSRTEAFLEWAAESPDQVLEMRERDSELKLAKLLATERDFYAETQKARRYRRSPQALAASLEEVPF